MGIRNWLQKRGYKKDVSTLDRTCAVIMQMGTMMPKNQLGKKLLDGVEGEYKKAIKKNPDITNDELLKDMRESRRFQELLQYLNMDMYHMEVLANECRKNIGGKN